MYAAIGSSVSMVNPAAARQYGRASLWVSSAGIVVGVLVIIIVSSVVATHVNQYVVEQCCNAYNQPISCANYITYACR